MQSDFCTHHSTEAALVQVNFDIHIVKFTGHFAILPFLELSAALDQLVKPCLLPETPFSLGFWPMTISHFPKLKWQNSSMPRPFFFSLTTVSLGNFIVKGTVRAPVNYRLQRNLSRLIDTDSEPLKLFFFCTLNKHFLSSTFLKQLTFHMHIHREAKWIDWDVIEKLDKIKRYMAFHFKQYCHCFIYT